MFRDYVYIIRSAVFFIYSLIKRRRYNIVFYYPQHFNRGSSGENLLFKHLLSSCDQNNISYVVFEEPDYKLNICRSSHAIPFDFIYLLVIMLRKILDHKDNTISKDQRIGKIISTIFFRNIRYKNFITISQSMLSLFRTINPNAVLYDLQHGIIHNNKPDYLVDGLPEDNLKINNVYLLLNGSKYQDILVQNDRTDFFKSHTFVIGSNLACSNSVHSCFNKNVLITLQFTHDHSLKENSLLFRSLKRFITSSSSTITFYLKDHPRFSNEIDCSEILDLDNVRKAPNDIRNSFLLCSVHVTAYSTSIFDAALFGVPTIIINPLKHFDYFINDFNYPLKSSLNKLNNSSLYKKESEIVREWARKYYAPFKESKFIDLIK